MSRNGLFSYFKNNGIRTLKKMCGCKTWISCKNIEEEMNNDMKTMEIQPTNKMTIVF
jgi:hypothetical protein